MLEKYQQRNTSSTAPSAVPAASPSPSYNRDTLYDPGLEPPVLLELLKAYYNDIGRPMPAVLAPPPAQYASTAAAAPSAKEKRRAVGDFEGARNFVIDVKRAYEHRPDVYKSFLDILHNYYQTQQDIPAVAEGVRKLFVDHPDFVERFFEYLPDSFVANDIRREYSASQPAVARESTNQEEQAQHGNKPPVRFADALGYLEQIKSRCSPGDYNVFLDIMKAFKAQTADTKEVLRRVTELFKDQPDLRTGFRVFLPPAYQCDI
jgi:paired amphipathic helix protein Sin3a